jgi:hypothetical protein
MQAVIGALRANLGLDSAQFERGARRANSTLDKMRNQFLAVAGAVKTMRAALTVMTVQTMRTIDEQAKLARAVGGTTVGLQALARAGDRAGVQQSELAAAATRLNQVLGAAIVSGKETEGVFKAIGISARALAAMDVDERFSAIADAMKAAGMSTQEMSFHLRQLGIRQASVITLIQSGSEEISRSRKAIDDFGVSVSEIDARQIERANDALSEVGRVFEGFRNQFAIAVAPAIERMANSFTEMAKVGQPLNAIFKLLISNLDRISFHATSLIVILGVRYVAALAAARLATLSLAASLAVLRTALLRVGIGVAIVAFGELVLFIDRAKAATGSFGDAFKMIALQVKAGSLNMKAFFIESINSMIGAFIEFTYVIADGLNNLFGTNLSGMDATITQVMGRAARSARDAADVASAAADALRTTLDDTEISAVNVSASLEEIEHAAEAGAEGASRAITKIEDRFASLRTAIQSSMEQGFMSIVDGTKTARDAFRNMAREIIAHLYRVLVVQRIVGAFGGGGILGAVGNAFPALIPAAANGTSYAQGGMTLVGERGPELVNLPRGSQVLDAQRTSSRMGDGDIIQHFNFNLSANGDESIRRMIAQAAPQIVEAAKSGVIDAKRRGGSYGRAFA